MEDIEGKSLKVGDEVVYKGRWNSLLIGKIIRFTPQQVRCGNTGEGKLCYPGEVYKIEKCQ